MQFAGALFVLGTIVTSTFAAKYAESCNNSCGELILPKTAFPDRRFPVIFNACKKHTRYQLESLVITYPNGSMTTRPSSLLFIKDINQQGKYTVTTPSVAPIFSGLSVRYTLNFLYSRKGCPFVPGTAEADIMVTTMAEAYPTLTMQPFYCDSHKYCVGDTVPLSVIIFYTSYPGLSFSDIVIYAIKDTECSKKCPKDSDSCSSSSERKRCSKGKHHYGDKKEVIASLDSFEVGTLAPYQVAEWVIPCKFKHSCVRVVLQYTITNSYGSFQEKSHLVLKVE